MLMIIKTIFNHQNNCNYLHYTQLEIIGDPCKLLASH